MPNASATLDPGWTKTMVFDSPSNSGLDENSIAIDSGGHVYIAYAYSKSGGNGYNLYVATNSSGSWTSELVDGLPNTGLHNSMAIDSSDNLHIAYFDWEHWCVKYATNVGGSWTIETVDPHDSTGSFGLSLALDANENPRVAYSNLTLGDYYVSVAEKVNGVWEHQNIDMGSSGKQIGIDISHAVDPNGFSHMSYVRENKLAYATNVSGSWEIETIDTTFEAGWGCWLAIDGSGHVGISYHITSTDPDTLMYITNEGGSWVNETVSTGTGGNTMIEYGPSGNPSILTYETTLKLFTKESGSWGYMYPTDDSYPGVASFAMDGNGKFHIAYPTSDLYYLTNSIAVDTTAPSISITSPTTDATYYTSVDHVTVGGSCSDDVGITGITWTNSEGGSGSVTVGSTWSVSIQLYAGENLITITASDGAGHSTSVMLTVYYTPDLTEPTVIILEPVSSGIFYTDTGSIPAGALSGTASDDVGIVSMAILNTNNAASASVITSDGFANWVSSTSIALNPGDNTIEVSAEDAAGNFGIAYLTVNYTEPINGPTVTIVSPLSGSIMDSTTVTVSWEGSDDTGIQGYQYNIDGTGWSTMSQEDSQTFDDLAQGEHTVLVKAYDLDDNFDTADVNFIVDTVEPTIPTVSPANGTITDSTEISWTGQDTGSGIANYTVRVDNGTWSDDLVLPTYEFAGLEDGSHWVQIRAYDLAGHYVDRFLSFVLDTSAPEIVITSPIIEGTYTTNVSALSVQGTALDLSGVSEMSWTNSRGGSGTAVLTDGGWNIASIVLKEGTNSITITAKDMLNNTATMTLTVVYHADKEESSGFDMVMLSLVVLVIVVLVLVALFLVIRGKKKRP